MSLPQRHASRHAAFPRPDAAALSHSDHLADLIRAAIDGADGALPFRRFMELALYSPGLGYYSAGTAKFGRDGDFVTAPEISPVFSACLARQCEQILRQGGGGTILELGAGSGAMACGVLAELERRGALPESYLILEPSADLRARQSARVGSELGETRSRVHWLDSLPEAPLRGVVLANEVLDALPVHRVRLHGGIVEEACVTSREGGLAWHYTPAGEPLAGHVAAMLADLEAALPDGFITEINLELDAFLASVSDVLSAGVALFLDYGFPRREYLHPQRTDGTLRCHYRHRAHDDPFLYPGLQDISAAVDFTAVAESAVKAGFDVRGFTTQAHFLMGCGIAEVAEGHAGGTAAGASRLGRELGLLTLPGEMGESVKVMALGRNLPPMSLVGFGIADHRHRL